MIAAIYKRARRSGDVLKQLLKDAQLSIEDQMDATGHDGMTVAVPLKRLSDLVGRIPKGHRTQELEWGDSTGKEIW